MLLRLDDLTQAFIMGWFGCLMSAFPVAMLFLLPKGMWADPSYEEKIKLLELQLNDHKHIIDELIKEQWNDNAISWAVSHYDQVFKQTEEKQESKTSQGNS
jgi:hypothetical protein